MKTALIIGSSGLTGSHLLKLLLESKEYNQVISFSYRESEVKHPKLTSHIVDFDKPKEYCHLVKGDDFFCTIGTTIKKAGSKEAFKKVDFGYPQQFAKCAMDNGVSKFLIISAMGANAKSPNFYSRTKGEIEQYLKATTFKSVSILRPSLLLGARKEFRLAENFGGAIMKVLSFAFIGPVAKYKAIQAQTLANAMYNIAQNADTGVRIYLSDELQQIGGNR